MIEQIQQKMDDLDWGAALLQASLLILLLFIIFLIPSLEPGQDLAVFSVSFAIVILSLLNSRSSEKQTEILEQQQQLLERQNKIVDEIKEQNGYQSDVLADLRDKIDEVGSTDEIDEEDSEKETEENTNKSWCRLTYDSEKESFEAA